MVIEALALPELSVLVTTLELKDVPAFLAVSVTDPFPHLRHSLAHLGVVTIDCDGKICRGQSVSAVKEKSNSLPSMLLLIHRHRHHFQ